MLDGNRFGHCLNIALALPFHMTDTQCCFHRTNCKIAVQGFEGG